MEGSAHAAAVRAHCERVLRQNWRQGVRTADGVPFGYTCPSPRRYPWQWYWDSCFAAIAWRRIEPARARAELASLLAVQRDDGFIGHTIFWDVPLHGSRRFTYNVLSHDAPTTATIQPPLLAWAWRIAVGDPAEQAAAFTRHHEWLAANRDLEGDGLLWILAPDESGLDASPQFDPIWGKRGDGRPGYLLLVRSNRRRRFDLRAIAAAGGPVCCEVLTNVLYNLSRLALGQPSLTAALIERCYDERRGLFLPRSRPVPRGPVPATVAALTPLALPDLPEAIGRRLVEEHLLRESRFWTDVPPPSVSLEEPSFSVVDRGRFGLLRLYWRGPTWINTAWLCWLGLVRLGYAEQAAGLERRIGAAVAAAGLREYYHPSTGAGMGATDFAWSSLAMELTEPDPAGAAASHVAR
jgi:Mannosylglycerate hydrolase MGH1-like glycoside hydrolase domain